MGTTTQQIEVHIERTRDALGSNLNELEQKVKSVTDWEQHFRNRPGTSLALAFGGGVVLAAMLGGRSKRYARQRSSRPATGTEPPLKTGRRSDIALESWDKLKGALIGVAAARLLNYAEEVFPGSRKYTRTHPVASEPSAR